jgi:hypothetical protein
VLNTDTEVKYHTKQYVYVTIKPGYNGVPNTDTEVKYHTKQYVYVLKSRMLPLNLVITAC